MTSDLIKAAKRHSDEDAGEYDSDLHGHGVMVVDGVEIYRNEYHALESIYSKLGRELDISSDLRIKIEDSHVVSIKFGYNEINSVPDEVLEFHELKELDVSTNYVRSLPESLSTLKRLNRLDTSCTLITEVSDILKKMPNLKYYISTSNNIDSIPDWIDELEDIRYIKLSGCSFSQKDADSIRKKYDGIIIDYVTDPEKLVRYE